MHIVNFILHDIALSRRLAHWHVTNSVNYGTSTKMADNAFSDSLFDEFDRDPQSCDQIIAENVVKNVNTEKSLEETNKFIDEAEASVDENELLGTEEDSCTDSENIAHNCILVASDLFSGH